jgi:hypothetical protein
VTPPSGRFIAQLFVVPSLIVLVAVLLLLGFRYATNTGHSPDYFLKQLDSDNPDIRWRAASDLAQILKRPEKESLKWKADAAFALDLARRLATALDDLATAEQEAAKRSAGLTDPAEKEAAWRKLATQRNHVSYLAAALGDFHVPVGAPLLCAMAERADSPDVSGGTLRRRQSLWALINLGEHTRGFAKLPPEQQAEVLAVLRSEASGSNARRAGWARTALHYLDKTATAESTDGVVRVDEVLARCADAQDRNVRELVAMAFNFWDGPLAESTLQRLAHDDGHGTLVRVTEGD